MRHRIMAFLLSVVLLPLFGGCTSYIDISGHVYEWTDAPVGAQSQVYYEETPPSAQQLIPVNGAKILLEDDDKSHVFSLESREDGYFHLGSTVELDEGMNIEGSRVGYQTAIGAFGIEETKNFYEFNIVLVPNR